MFTSRTHAGILLSEKLEKYRNKSDVVVVGIPRGGVVVARKVANVLPAPLEIVVIRKISAPDNSELAIGAIGPDHVVYWDDALIARLNIDQTTLAALKNGKEQERKQRENLLRGTKHPLDLRGKTAILVDDGVATGATVLCASLYLKKKKTKRTVLAIPVISKETLETIRSYFDEVVVVDVPEEFYAVGQYYNEFEQVEDEEVRKIL